jgi:hypothetical protein
MKNNFCAIILSHGRPKKIHTYQSLKKAGYTGEIFILIDNEDLAVNEYKKIYGDQVEVFDKKAYSDLVDEMDNFENRKVILHARNASFDIAKKRGYKYFIQLDDDYTHFSYKFNERMEYKETMIKNIEKVFDLLIDFKNLTKADTVCFAQNGDFMGGGKGSFGKEIKLRRKAMNSFICDTEKRFWFKGRLNEDVNLYTYGGNTGKLIFTIPQVSLSQKTTQKSAGGMTDAYLDGGTYVKSFYSVMLCPAFVKIKMMGEKHKRLHHSVKWKNAVPMILHPKHKKDV